MSIGEEINQKPEKTTALVDADLLVINDSADSNKMKYVTGDKLTKPGDVIDDVVSTDTDKPLSANQGKLLNDSIGGFASFGLFENAIINPIDENMVDQYGSLSGATLATIGTEYLIDRWKNQRTGSSDADFTYTKNSDNIKIEKATGGTESCRILMWQEIEDVNYKRLDGEQVTLSAKVTSDSSDCRIFVRVNSTIYYASSAHTGGGSEETLSVTVSSANMTSLTNLAVYVGISGISGTALASVSIDQNKDFSFNNVKLEKGSSATSYKPRQYSEELALCQRYAYLCGDDSIANQIGWCISTSTGQVVVSIFLPYIFRATPTSITATSTDWAVSDGVTTYNVTGGNAINTSVSGRNVCAIIYEVGGGGLTANQVYRFEADGTSGRRMLITAEL